MKINYPDLLNISKKIGIFLLCAACGWFLKAKLTPSGSMMGMGGGEVYIVAQKAHTKDVSSFEKKISYIESLNEVSILPQVTGTVEKILFSEGSIVKEGDVLFEIDSSKYQAAYDLSKARLDSAEANYVKAKRDYDRQVKLSSEKFASKATFDSSESAYLQAKAAVEEARANLDIAAIDLSYTKVTAPISGKIGKALVTKGNFVVASSIVLAKIVQIDPIRISFALTDKEVASLQQKELDKSDLTAQILLANGDIIKKKVVNTFFDNAVNPATATLSVYADIENSDYRLIPGNYVQSAISDNKPVYSVVIPQTAINFDTEGAFVYVAKIDETKSKDNDIHGIAEQRRVVLGEVNGSSNQIIKDGLKDGELVIVQGTIKIRNDAPIRIGILTDK